MFIMLATIIFRILYSKIFSFLDLIFPRRFRIYKLFPISAYEILYGIILGLFIYFTGIYRINQYFTFDENLFFLFLVPPIMLNAGYFADQLFFFRNLWTILLYAMLGTILCCLLVGLALWGVSSVFISSYLILDLFLFSAILSSVDPIAVLDIFEMLHVNETLHSIVFGEWILNDAASIVLYRLFEALRPIEYLGRIKHNLIYIYIILGIFKLLYVGIGGIIVGIVCGIVCSFITKFTANEEKIEPIMVLVFGYLSYFLGESILASGVTSILTCGLIMARYVELNIGKNSHIAVKWIISALSSTSEGIIFIYLGISFVVHDHTFDLFQILLTIVFITLFRFIFIYAIGIFDNLVFQRNEKKKERVGFRTMFIIAFGGLRGAVSFALAYIIPDQVITQDGAESWEIQKKTLITTTLIVIVFTIGIQGTLMQPLLKILKIRPTKQSEKELKEDLKREQNFLHHEEKEILQAVEKIEFLQKSVYMIPEGYEKEDYLVSNKKLTLSLISHIVDHVGRVIKDLEKMNQKITNFMKLDASDKSNTEFTREIFRWRLNKIEEIKNAWHTQLISLDSKEKYKATINVYQVIQKLRSNLFKLSKNPIRVENEEQFELEESFISEKKTKKYSEDDILLGYDPLEYSSFSFVELLYLHEVIEFERDTYYAVPNARDENFLFFLDRILLIESLKEWKRNVQNVIDNSEITNILSFLKHLRKIIHIQTENRLQQLSQLKVEAFADVVFGMGIVKTTPIVSIIAKQWTFSRKIRNLFTWIDELIQKIVTRGLHSDEKQIMLALRKIRKDEMEEHEYRDLNVAYDELVQGKGLKDLKEKSLRNESETIAEILFPNFLNNLEIKSSPSTFINDELYQYRRKKYITDNDTIKHDFENADELSEINFSRHSQFNLQSPIHESYQSRVSWLDHSDEHTKDILNEKPS